VDIRPRVAASFLVDVDTKDPAVDKTTSDLALRQKNVGAHPLLQIAWSDYCDMVKEELFAKLTDMGRLRI
jgi:hypothetical protein